MTASSLGGRQLRSQECQALKSSWPQHGVSIGADERGEVELNGGYPAGSSQSSFGLPWDALSLPRSLALYSSIPRFLYSSVDVFFYSCVHLFIYSPVDSSICPSVCSSTDTEPLRSFIFGPCSGRRFALALARPESQNELLSMSGKPKGHITSVYTYIDTYIYICIHICIYAYM